MSVTEAPSLPATLGLGPVEITVADLDRSLEFYERSLGLHLQRRDDSGAELGDGDKTSVILALDPQARPAGRHAGLYHYALLFPSREELARTSVRLAAAGAPIQGASDHGSHEAIYLPDPDGNGIELAADRSPDQWITLEQEFSRGGPQPLDVGALLATVAGEQPTAKVGPGLRVGHVHLHVGDIEQALAFYRDLIGLGVRFTMATAAFLAAGDYHHHLGVNTWQGEGVGPPEHSAGLRHWTIRLDTPAQVAEVRDRLEAAGADVEAAGGGFTVRDPWTTALRIESAA
ncbi:MAG: catechol 2,3-dioxygenase [Solirubrobacteraceae bacterium]|nr:catechol 2,3-dioxygenase [Solirubrobacteraceae bacterium]